MAHSHLPDNWEDLIAGYVLDCLTDDEAKSFECLLVEHPELTIEIERYVKTSALLMQTIAAESAPTHLKSKILKVVLSQTERPTLIPIQPRYQFGMTRQRLVLGGIGSLAALGFLAIGIDNYFLRLQLQETQRRLTDVEKQLTDSQATVASLQKSTTGVFLLTAAAGNSAYGNATFTANNQNITITAQSLPSLPSDQVYRLWAVLENNPEPIFCGQFKPDANGRITKSWMTPPPIADAAVIRVFVTSERMADPKQPKGDNVLQTL